MNLRGLRIPVTLVFLAVSFSTAFSQTTFQKYMVMADSLSEGFCVAGFNDGKTAVGGQYAVDLTSGNTDAIVFMLDENGERLWTLKLGDDNAGESISDMEGLSDGGLLVSYVSVANGDLIFSSVVRISKFGAIVWSKKIANNSDIYGTNITNVTGGFILNGNSGSGPTASVIKIDLFGNTIWTRTFKEIAIGNSGVSQDNQGNIHIAGNSDGGAIWAKLNGTDGTFLGMKSFASANFLAFEVCKVIQNDSVLLIGTDYTSNFVLLKTDLNGNPGSIVRYQYGTATLYPLAIHASGNGEFVLSLYQEGGSNQGGILARFSNTLNPTWSKIYANSNGNTSYFLDMDDTGTGYVAAGTFTANNKNRALIVKTDFSGNVFGKCCPKDIDLNKLAVTQNASVMILSETAAYQLEDFTVTGTMIGSEPTPVCITNENINVADTLLCPGQCTVVLLGGSEQGVNYTWQFNGGTPESSTAVNPGKVCYNNEGAFPIKVFAENCLLDSAGVRIDNTPDQFPNAFTPNGDLANATFKPYINCPVEEYRLQIFNRWGDLIYETYDVNQGWDGQANGEPAPVDVYIYRVEFYAVRDGVRTLVFNKMKEVTLLR